MGERRSVRGTESTEDMARVEEITHRADTGHSNTTGNLNTQLSPVSLRFSFFKNISPVFHCGNDSCSEHSRGHTEGGASYTEHSADIFEIKKCNMLVMCKC